MLKIDIHSHVDVVICLVKKVDLRMAMKRAGMDVIGMMFAVDNVTLEYNDHAWERFLNALAEQDAILMDCHMTRTLNAQQAIEAWKRHESIVIHLSRGDISSRAI